VPHLSYEEVRDAAEGRPSKLAQRHLEACAECRAEVADLAGFATSLGRKARARLPSGAPAFPRWAIAAAILIGLSPFAWWIWRRGSEPRYALAVHDGGAWVGLDFAGRLHTPSKIPADCAAAVREALETGHLPFPAGYRRGQPEVLLGSPARTNPPVTIGYPKGEAVITTRPQFQWNVSAPFDSYRVNVYDRDFHLVAASPELHATLWVPDRDLAPGTSYTWMVTAQSGRREIRAPVPPAPEARFTVLSQAETTRLNQLMRRFPGEHLMLATVFAQAGVAARARQEVQLLEQANPKSALVHGLAASLPGTAASDGSR